MSVRVEHPAPRVAELVMDRPAALNAVDAGQARALAGACAELADAADLSVVILSSAVPGAFCVGADLKERAGWGNAELLASRPVSRAAYAAVLDLPMPTVAAVDGYALGGGCELALSCDLVVAGPAAVFGLPEVGVGLVPGGGGTQLLSRRIGSGRAADLLFTARRVDRDEAFRLGLADRAVTGDVRAAALELAVQVAGHSPVALRQAKWALRAGADLDLPSALLVEDQAWRRAAAAPDRVEGIAAFTERRAPRWPPPAAPGGPRR